MAKNLRAKIPKEDTLTVYDVNQTSLDKLKSEVASDKLHIAKSPQEVAHNSVSPFVICITTFYDESYCSIYDLSWGYSFRAMLLF